MAKKRSGPAAPPKAPGAPAPRRRSARPAAKRAKAPSPRTQGATPGEEPGADGPDSSGPEEEQLDEVVPAEVELAEVGAEPGPGSRPRSALPLDEAEEEAELEEPGTYALSRTDPLARYMHEVHRHPVLSREEEHELAVRYGKTGDVDAAYKLVASNLRLVVKIAYEYRRAAFSVLDLIQEGNVGLMQAVRKYDPYKGVKLSSYAAWWIRAYILRFIMDNWRMVKLGTTQAQRKLFFNLRKEQAKLAAEGFGAEPRLLAERLSVTEQEVQDMDQRLSGDEHSLDTPASDEGGPSLSDRLSQPQLRADDALGDAELKAVLREHLQTFAAELSGKERFIFEKRLMAEEPLTLQQIGDEYGISRERARQLEARLIGRLREELREKLPDFAELIVEEKG